MGNPRELLARAIWDRHYKPMPDDLPWDAAPSIPRDECLALADTFIEALEAAGYWIAPNEPTQAMLDAGRIHAIQGTFVCSPSCYRAIRDAAKGKNDD